MRLIDRPTITNRDVFDIWFLLSRKIPVNPKIIEARMEKTLSDYLSDCISTIENINSKKLLFGVGDLLDGKMKSLVRNKLKDEVLEYLRFYQKYPIL